MKGEAAGGEETKALEDHGVPSSTYEDPQAILAEVMERCRLSERERQAYVQRMSRALLLENAEVMRLYCGPDGEAQGEEP